MVLFLATFDAADNPKGRKLCKQLVGSHMRFTCRNIPSELGAAVIFDTLMTP